jgi:hypothetical protein
MALGSSAAVLATAAGLAAPGYYLVVTGKLTLDCGWGRRIRTLGPFGIQIAAPAPVVFDVIAAPYLGPTPRAMAGKLRVLQRGTDMAPAEHYTPVHGGPPPWATRVRRSIARIRAWLCASRWDVFLPAGRVRGGRAALA